MSGVECDESFEISEALYDTLTSGSSKCKRLQPSRQVLLAVHQATHGSGCILQRKEGGMVDGDKRERTLVELWRKLTGDETTAASEILVEAAAANRKNANVRTASPSHRRWLASPPARFGPSGFGSTVDRLHPIEAAGKTNSTLASPGVGSYYPQEIESAKNKGSSWRSTSTVSRLRKADEEGDDDAHHRSLPWDAKDLAPGAQAYRTSCRDMGKQATSHARARSPSPGMARPTSASRLSGVKSALQERQPGPGSYDQGGFNLSRKDHTRPMSGFKSKTPRESPFGAKTPMSAGKAPSSTKSPMVAGGMAALEASLPWACINGAPRSPNKCGREL